MSLMLVLGDLVICAYLMHFHPLKSHTMSHIAIVHAAVDDCMCKYWYSWYFHDGVDTFVDDDGIFHGKFSFLTPIT